jgi:hypothetical protein
VKAIKKDPLYFASISTILKNPPVVVGATKCDMHPGNPHICALGHQHGKYNQGKQIIDCLSHNCEYNHSEWLCKTNPNHKHLFSRMKKQLAVGLNNKNMNDQCPGCYLENVALEKKQMSCIVYDEMYSSKYTIMRMHCIKCNKDFFGSYDKIMITVGLSAGIHKCETNHKSESLDIRMTHVTKWLFEIISNTKASDHIDDMGMVRFTAYNKNTPYVFVHESSMSKEYVEICANYAQTNGLFMVQIPENKKTHDSIIKFVLSELTDNNLINSDYITERYIKAVMKIQKIKGREIRIASLFDAQTKFETEVATAIVYEESIQHRCKFQTDELSQDYLNDAANACMKIGLIFKWISENKSSDDLEAMIEYVKKDFTLFEY